MSANGRSQQPTRSLKRKRATLSPVRSETTSMASHVFIHLTPLLPHPPTHPLHVPSLYASLASLRTCLSLHHRATPGSNDLLFPELECKAWTMLAEVGMIVIGAGLCGKGKEKEWTDGIEAEIETAVSKGLLLSQRHPSLQCYKPHLTLLHSHLAQWQHNTKFSRSLVRKLIASLSTHEPPHSHYTSLLTLHNHLSNPSDTPSPSISDIHASLQPLQTMHALALTYSHPYVARLASVTALITMVRGGMWQDVGNQLAVVERELALVTQGEPKADCPTDSNAAVFASLQIHALIIAILYHNHVGSAADASQRLAQLHTLLDENRVGELEDGVLTLPLPPGPSLIVQSTHPRVLYELAFLVSSVSKRDVVGRKPRRKAFAAEGISASNQGEEIKLPAWSGLRHAYDVEERLARIKADLMCEMASVCIMRSEFQEAKHHLATLIAHTRTFSIYPSYSARICLHYAHLFHALGLTSRALQCYRAAAHLSQLHNAAACEFVSVAASAGEIGLRLGLGQDVRHKCAQVVKECRAAGGTLAAVGLILEACSSKEIVKAKQYLRAALDHTTRTEDNYLRALILALTSAHYFHTHSEHAEVMLTTCRQLAAGLGAADVKLHRQKTLISGNLRLGLWAGEKFLELYKRMGKDDQIQKQQAANIILKEVLKNIGVDNL